MSRFGRMVKVVAVTRFAQYLRKGLSSPPKVLGNVKTSFKYVASDVRNAIRKTPSWAREVEHKFREKGTDAKSVLREIYERTFVSTIRPRTDYLRWLSSRLVIGPLTPEKKDRVMAAFENK